MKRKKAPIYKSRFARACVENAVTVHGSGGNPTVWHYTTLTSLHGIIEDGRINPATTGVPKGERPACWFSRHTVYEPTAQKLIADPKTGRVWSTRSIQELARYDTPVRLGVSNVEQFINWREFKRVSGVTARMARGLERAAAACGANPAMWLASFDPVPLAQVETIEVWAPGHGWQMFGNRRAAA